MNLAANRLIVHRKEREEQEEESECAHYLFNSHSHTTLKEERIYINICAHCYVCSLGWISSNSKSTARTSIDTAQLIVGRSAN